MSYNYLTQFNSPNFTPAAQTQGVWHTNRNIQHIDIHWWGDPNTNPTFEGVIATFVNPNSGRSANFVATGDGRRVACLVAPGDNSWATVQDNPFSISIECDPRCRPEDYDVVAELIADIRSAYGQGLTLHPHREFYATACPGNWDLAKLDALSRTKVSHDPWGNVTDAAPAVTADQINQAYMSILERPADQDGINHYLGLHWNLDQIKSDLTNSTEHAALLNTKAIAAAAAVAAATPVPKAPAKVPTPPAAAAAPTWVTAPPVNDALAASTITLPFQDKAPAPKAAAAPKLNWWDNLIFTILSFVTGRKK